MWPITGMSCPVERLVEAEEMVVTLCPGEPFARADDVPGIGRVDADVGLRLVRHEHRSGCRVRRDASRLSRIWRGAGVLAGRAPRTGGFAGVSVVRPVVERRRNLGPVAAHLAAGHEIIGDVVGCVASRRRSSRPAFLRHVADPASTTELEAGARPHGQEYGMQQRRNQESGGPCGSQHPSVFSTRLDPRSIASFNERSESNSRKGVGHAPRCAATHG